MHFLDIHLCHRTEKVHSLIKRPFKTEPWKQSNCLSIIKDVNEDCCMYVSVKSVWKSRTAIVEIIIKFYLRNPVMCYRKNYFWALSTASFCPNGRPLWTEAVLSRRYDLETLKNSNVIFVLILSFWKVFLLQ